MQDLSSLTKEPRIKPMLPAVEVHSPNYWTIRRPHFSRPLRNVIYVCKTLSLGMALRKYAGTGTGIVRITNNIYCVLKCANH